MIVVSSGAIALARRTPRPDAGAAAGWRRSRPPPRSGRSGWRRPGPRRWRPRPDRGATAADARRHRGPPPLPQRARDAGHAARPRLRAGDQRERQRGDRGDPLRRQRPAGRARRRDGRRPISWCCCPTSTGSTPPIRARDPAAAHIPVVAAITPEIEAMGGEPPPGYSVGRHAHQAGGRRASPRRRAARWRSRCGAPDAPAAARWRRARAAPGSCRAGGAVGAQALDRRHAGAAGRLLVDAGAARALAAGGRCCRPACARSRATFERGDAVEVRGPDGAVLARGLVAAYAAPMRARIIGHRCDEIEAILGWRGRDEMIHRDDLVLV